MAIAAVSVPPANNRCQSHPVTASRRSDLELDCQLCREHLVQFLVCCFHGSNCVLVIQPAQEGEIIGQDESSHKIHCLSHQLHKHHINRELSTAADGINKKRAPSLLQFSSSSNGHHMKHRKHAWQLRSLALMENGCHNWREKLLLHLGRTPQWLELHQV